MQLWGFSLGQVLREQSLWGLGRRVSVLVHKMSTAGSSRVRTKEATKILMLGDTQVGKTSIMLKFCDNLDNIFDVKSTVGVDFRVKTLTVDGHTVRLQIWDTAGQERFRSIGKGYYRGSEGIVVVFDLTRESSFDHVDNWIKSVRLALDDEETPILLLGNKNDLKEARVVDQRLLETYTQRLKLPYWEVSACTGENVEEAFTEFTRKIVAKKMADRSTQDEVESLVLTHKAGERGPSHSSGCC